MDKQKFFIWCVVRRNLAKNSIKHRKQSYDALFKWLNGSPLTSETVESYILYLREKGLRNATLNFHISTIALIETYEHENGNDINLTHKVSYFPKQKKVPTILSVDEIDAILTAQVEYGKSWTVLKARNGIPFDHNHEYKLLWWLVAGTGCRIEEALSLKKTHLILGLEGKGKVHFVDTKTQEDRKVPLPPELVNELIDHIKEKKPTDYVFMSSMGNRLNVTSSEEDLKKRGKIAGINKHLYPHAFRNSYIMEHYRRRTDPFTISKLVGHRDINTTLGYMRFDEDDLERGAENHPLFSRAISPQRIVDKIKQTIEGFKLSDDKRLDFKQIEGSNSFSFTVYIR